MHDRLRTIATRILAAGVPADGTAGRINRARIVLVLRIAR
jgi:hypothetical protein